MMWGRNIKTSVKFKILSGYLSDEETLKTYGHNIKSSLRKFISLPKFMFNLAGIPLIAIQTALENHYFAEHWRNRNEK